jgi:hypothetical protein
MRFLWKQEKQTKIPVQISAAPDDKGKNSAGLMTGVEKGFSEVFLFIFSVVLHMSHSLGREHGARL